jgi:hypothetical protein
MKPIGLTIKKGKNKYQSDSRGELMLIHECVECQTLSINRIAADDDSGTVMAVFQESFIVNRQIHAICREQGIVILSIEDIDVVYSQLYGRHAEFPVLSLR